MKKLVSKNQIGILLLAISTCCILAFQNCSNGFHRVYEVTTESSQSSTLDESDDSTNSQSSSDSNTNNGTSNNGNNSSNNSNDGSSSGTIDPSLLFNFVADSQQACDASVQNRLGVATKCSFGGACGVSCGRPGPNCESSALGRYGACLDSKGKAECKKAGTKIAFQNCGGITQPSSEIQVADKALTGCCSDTIYRVCSVSGNNIANSITCQ